MVQKTKEEQAERQREYQRTYYNKQKDIKNEANPKDEQARVEVVKDRLFDQSERSFLAGKEYLKATGNYIEKSEVKTEVAIAPDDCIRLAGILIERIRVYDLGRNGGGDGVVQGEGRLLPEPVCVDTE